MTRRKQQVIHDKAVTRLSLLISTNAHTTLALGKNIDSKWNKLVAARAMFRGVAGNNAMEMRADAWGQ